MKIDVKDINPASLLKYLNQNNNTMLKKSIISSVIVNIPCDGVLLDMKCRAIDVSKKIYNTNLIKTCLFKKESLISCLEFLLYKKSALKT